MRKNEKITALYERLSRDDFGKDDDQQRESNSISNQKAMLEEFAARQGFTNIVHSRTMALVVPALTVPDFGNDERSGSRECGVSVYQGHEPHGS